MSNPAAPTKAGQFAFGGLAVVPLGNQPRLLMLSEDFGEPVVLRLLDTETFTQLDSTMYPDLELDWALDLVSTDGQTFAFAGATGYNEPPRLYMLTSLFDG